MLYLFPSASAKGRNDLVGRLWNLLKKMGRMETFTCAALGGPWRIATIRGAQAIHTLSEFSQRRNTTFGAIYLTLIRARQ